jgi:hypothetical protein
MLKEFMFTLHQHKKEEEAIKGKPIKCLKM